MNMHICTIRLLVVSLCCLSIGAGTVPASCKPDLKIDWNRQPPDFSNFEPFSNPGELLPNVTVHDTLDFVGLLWNAPSWQEVMRRACIHCGPFLYAQYPDEQIRQTCDMIITSLQMGEKSDISGMCISYLKNIEVESAARISRYHNFFRFLNFSPSDFEQLRINLAFGLLKLLGPSPFSGDWFDACFLNFVPRDFERLGINLALGVLKSLGLSPFSGDMFDACSEVLLSKNIDESVNKVKTLLAPYVGTLTLKYMHRFDVCTNGGHKVRELLQRIQEDICDFLSKDHLMRDYAKKGAGFIEDLLSVHLNVDFCTDVIDFLSSYDEFGATGYLITKRNFESWSNRHHFCREIVPALTGNTQTDTYVIPHNYNIKNWHVFDEAGQILPDFYFLDAVNVFSAFIRSDTFFDGGVVLCDVFESFLSKEFDPTVKDLCNALRNGDIGTVEKKCRSMFPPAEHSSTRTTESPVMFTIVTAVNMTTKLLDLPAITPERVCSPLDYFFYSKNNLQSVTRLGLNDIIAYILPTVNFLCQHYDLFLVMLKGKVSHGFFITYQQIAPELEDVILSHLGFSSQTQICQSVAAGINTFSGTAKSSFTKNMEDQVLKFLTDTGRCTASVKSLKKLFTTFASLHDIDVYGFSQYTGYLSITHLCETMSDIFDQDRCKDTSSEEISSHSKDMYNKP